MSEEPEVIFVGDRMYVPYSEYKAAIGRTSKLEDCIRELLKSGEHEGECDNDPSGYGGACMKHCEASEAREQAARKILGE